MNDATDADQEQEGPPLEAYEEPQRDCEQLEESPLSKLMNIDAEKSILGTLISSPDVLDLLDGILKPEHFAYIGHVELFRICRDLIMETQTADFISVLHKLKMGGSFEDFGGQVWFASVVASATAKMSATGQAAIVRDLYYRRKLSNLGTEIQQNALDVEGDASQLIEDAERELSELVGDSATEKERTREDAIASTLLHLEKSFNNPGALTGLSTGLTRLDSRLLGLQPANLIILAGRPSMGKTAVAQCIAEYNANQHYLTEGEAGTPVLFFSKEMSAEEINIRLVSSRVSVDSKEMMSGRYRNKEDWQKVVNGTQELNKLPLFVDDSGGLTSRGIWAKARRMKRRHNIGLIIIDQLSHIRFANPAGRKVDELGRITKDLKAMAKELGVPVVLLHQLSRGVESRDDKRPMLSDLRDSGEIEQDADIVLFVYREQYYLERSEPSQRGDESPEKFGKRLHNWELQCEAARGKAEIIIGKLRMGEIGRAVVAFQGAYTRFGNLDALHNDDQTLFD